MSNQSNYALLYDASGNPIVVNDGSAPGGTAGLVVSGYDGTNARRLKTDSGGQPVVNQGVANSLANAWTMKQTDGTNVMPTGDAVARSVFFQVADGTTGPAAVKAASTAPVATDKALVVVLSPNQPAIPVTTTPATATPGIALGYIVTTAVTNVPVRATTYTEQSANFTGSIVSSSANDAAAGTGARIVLITWMNAAGTTVGTETATLNGTTAVNLATTTKCFIEKIEVLTVGSGGSNAGTITLWTGAGATGTAVGSIAVGDNRTFWAHHYVVTGKTANITGMTGLNNNSSNQTVFSLQSQVVPTANQVTEQVSDWITGGLTNQTLRTYGSLIKVPGPAKVTMFAAPGGTPSIKNYGSFDFYDA
jgi:hypothetical protein